jgi:hypothetical protein
MAGLFGNFIVPSFLAQPADLAAWTSAAAPANAIPLLRSASSLVLSATSTSYYDSDPTTGLPTDPVVAQVFNDATCIQAAAWAALGIDPLTGGVTVAGVEQSKSIGTAHITYADAGLASAAKAQALSMLVPEAVRKLVENNLMDSNVWIYGLLRPHRQRGNL